MRAMSKSLHGDAAKQGRHHSDDAVKRGMNSDVKNCIVHRCVPRCSIVVH